MRKEITFTATVDIDDDYADEQEIDNEFINTDPESFLAEVVAGNDEAYFESITVDKIKDL